MPNSAAHAAPMVLPRHVAIIMDGNGRWAKARHAPRAFGHQQGVEALRRAVKAARDIGLQYLTVYGFSTENWNRPQFEIDALMNLLRVFVTADLEKLHRDNVRIRIIGVRDGLAEDVQDIVRHVQDFTAANTGLNFSIAFNYGAHREILEATRALARDVAAGKLSPEDIDATLFESKLLTAELPPPDILLRTSGEQRLSNFLLWQSAYSELVFTDVLWPDFKEEDLRAAVATFGQRDRRYGGLKDGR